MTHSRREVIVSAAAAAAVLGADRRIAFIPSALAQKAPAEGFHRFKVGDIEVTQIADGHWEKPHDPAFIKNVTVDETKAALKAGGLTDAHVTIPFTATVLKIGGKTVMIDSGTGGQLAPTAGKLPAGLAAAGIDGKKIDTIVVTHFHPDHIFGLMAKDTDAQIYPDAEIIVPAAELKWWSDPGVFTKLPEARHGLAKRIQATLGKWKNVRVVEGEREVVPGLRALEAHGHTAGHTVYVAGAGTAAPLMLLADTSNIPALFVKNPGWHVVFDGDPQQAEANRRRLFDRAVADKAIVTGYHFGLPGAGTFAKDGNGYAFTPVA